MQKESERGYSRCHCGAEEERKVERVEEDGHGFIPAQHHESAIHPIGYLCNAGHRAPFGFHVVRVRITAEFVGEFEDFGLREDDERCLEVELVDRCTDCIRGQCILRGRVLRGYSCIEGYEFKGLEGMFNGLQSQAWAHT